MSAIAANFIANLPDFVGARHRCDSRASSSRLPTWTFVLGVVPSPSLTPGDALSHAVAEKQGGLFMQGSAAMSISAFGRGWFIAAVGVGVGFGRRPAPAPGISAGEHRAQPFRS